ncbi:MAG: hypothetical protein IPN60_01980 [Saprospiraceae bacterium]|nr:hypothetical protein [Candidatus Opimibacter skivensis]MBP9744663.1 hypothetical protein [Saprospiraceae bacterium]
MLRTSKFFAPPLVVSRNTFKFLLVACTFTFLISSCHKDEIKADITTESDGQYDMYYRILSFIETMEGKPLSQPQLQPRTVYSPSDVILYVEGAMNLQYADTRPSWTSFENQTDTFTIAISSGYASQSAVDALFDEVRDSASNHFYSITEPDKFPALYDGAIIAFSSTQVTLTFLSKVGTISRDPTPFGSTDYWDVQGGKCSPYSGGTLEASEVIANALNDYYAPYGCTFYSNVETAYYSDLYTYGWGNLNSSDPTPSDFIIDYRTYEFYCWDYQSWGDPDIYGCYEAIGFPDCGDFDMSDIRCLEPWEMNYYFESITEIYEDYLAGQPNPYLTHAVSTITLNGPLCLQVQEGWDPIIHFGQRNSCLASIFPTTLPPCC